MKARALLLLIFGQSNARSRGDAVTPETDFPDSLCSFNGGSQRENDTNAPQPASDFSALVPFTDSEPGGQEPIAPGFAIAARSISDGGHWERIVAHTSAVGRTSYAGLVEREAQKSLMLALANGHRLLLEDGYDDDTIDIVLFFDHGEAETVLPGIEPGEYAAILSDLRETIDFHTRVLTGRTRSVPILTGGPVRSAEDDLRDYASVQDGHIQAIESVADVHFVGPKYPFPHDADAIHIDATGKRLWAEYLAHRLVTLLNEGWMPLVRPTAAHWSGTTLSIDFATVSGDLVLDTIGTAIPSHDGAPEGAAHMPDTKAAYPASSRGVELLVDNVPVELTEPAVTGKTLTFTTAQADTGSTRTVRFGQPNIAQGLVQVVPTGADPDNSESDLPRTNIRDEGEIALPSGTARHWCVQTSLEIS